MKAFEVIARGVGTVSEVPEPVPGAGQVVVDVAFVGLCGTDAGLFNAGQDRLDELQSQYPLRLGHEWSGTVSAVGPDADPALLGRRVTGDTMLGCGHCLRCLDGRHHLCEQRREIGVRGGWPGALAEKLLVPVTALRTLPGSVSTLAGALVEPGGNAYRAVVASWATAGTRLLVLGTGTIGLLAAMMARAVGAQVHVLGVDPRTMSLAEGLGLAGVWTGERLPQLEWDAVIDGTDAPGLPGYAIEVAEPGRRVVLIGVAHTPSEIDTRRIVRKDLTVVGVLGASQGLEATIALYAAGTVEVAPLVAATIGLADVGRALAGWRPDDAGPGPKLLVQPGR